MGEKKMGTTEQEKQTLIMRDMMCLGGRVFRNNVGEYKVGDRYIRYGLCPGSSDIIGWTPVKITPEMVGTTLPVFTAVEVKKDDAEIRSWKKSKSKRASGQRNFLNCVNDHRGLAVIASDSQTCIEDILDFIKKLQGFY
jgi:hypothetical protein